MYSFAEAPGCPRAEEYSMRKAYERPAIVHTEKLEARASTCSKVDNNTCPGGPVQS